MKLNKKILLFFLFSMLCVISSIAHASSEIKRLKEDLTTITGNLILIQKNQYAINKGSNDGVRTGELWTVYEEGTPVKDPQTGIELGRSLKPIGHLRVTKVNERFSEVDAICPQKCELKNGLPVKRFSDVQAVFYDLSNINDDLYERLRVALPQLHWGGKTIIQNPSKMDIKKDQLIFVRKDANLTVWSGGEIFGLYELEQGIKTTSLDKKTESPPPSQPIPSVIAPTKIAGIRKQIDVSTFRTVGSLDHFVYYMEIFELTKDGPAFFVFFYDNDLVVQSINSQKRYTYNYKGFGEIVSISTGPLGVIAVNILERNKGFSSKLIQFTGEGFKELASYEPYIFMFFDLDGDGEKETLLGQNFDTADIFGVGVWKFKLEGNSLKKAGSFPIPPSFQLNGSIIYDIDRNGILDYGFYLVGRKFVIYQGKTPKWESPEQFGGSIKSINYEENPGMRDLKFARMIFWSPPALINLGDTCLLAIAANESSIWTLVGAEPKRGSVGLIIPYAGGYRYHELGTKFDGPIQSLFTYKDELYIVVVEGNFFTRRGRTHVVALPLEEIINTL